MGIQGDEQPAQADGHAAARASVHACGWETHYLRAGSGAPVLLLEPQPETGPSTLFDALAAGHRVIAPSRPVHSVGPAAPDCGCADGREPTGTFDARGWLGDLLEGLGLMEVALVVTDPALSAAACQLAAEDPLRITRLVLVAAAGEASPAPDEARVLRLPHPGRSHQAREATTREIRTFLSAPRRPDDAETSNPRGGLAPP